MTRVRLELGSPWANSHCPEYVLYLRLHLQNEFNIQGYHFCKTKLSQHKMLINIFWKKVKRVHSTTKYFKTSWENSEWCSHTQISRPRCGAVAEGMLPKGCYSWLCTDKRAHCPHLLSFWYSYWKHPDWTLDWSDVMRRQCLVSQDVALMSLSVRG